jgi:hypothetical protein
MYRPLFNHQRIGVLEQDRQCMYNVILRRIHESMLKWKSNKYYIFVRACACVHVALLIQHATGMRPIVTSFVAPSGSTIFFDIIS